ncbi:MAG: LytR family transcriptional regulator [Chloroflexi bacterium]|nr:MAG: LytR family transcriptional regulator [Chloroflexota bacterium]
MPKISFQRFPIRRIVFWGLALVIAAGSFVFVRTFTICWRLTSLPGIPDASCAGETVNPLETPVVVGNTKTPKPTSTPELFASEDIQYPTWDGGSRINILFVGLRGGDPIEGDCPFCTDTLILLTVDPTTKTAGMLSIPRDMWVNIPGFGYSRINTAWTLGRGSKLPGGGPALTMRTISHFIGVPVDYYVQVDFDTFVDIIDLVGGVDVYNDETIVLDPMSHGKDFPKVRITCCGMRHLNGTTALAFARCRHAEQGCKDGDVGRAKRQQKVIFGIRDKVLSPENFPKLLAQAPKLYNTFSDGIHTNMSLEDAIKLAVMAQDVPKENIKNGVIEHNMMSFGNVILGGQNASIMKPLPDKIRVLRDEIFTSSGPTSPMAEGDPAALMQADGARIRLLNGTNTAQLEERTASYLSQQGLLVTELGNTKAQSRTTIVLYAPKLYALRFLHSIFGIARSSQILIRPDPSQTVDIEVWLGNDWVSNLPSGY